MRASASPLLSRSPPRPSPGSLHYSDEDVAKYNDLIPAESSSLTEKPSEISDSQVRDGGGAPEMWGGGRRPSRLGTGPVPSSTGPREQGAPGIPRRSYSGRPPHPKLRSGLAPWASGVPRAVASALAAASPQAQPQGSVKAKGASST